MLESSTWFKQIPIWVWLSCIPFWGGLAIIYAGQKSKNSAWLWLGVSITVAALAAASSQLAPAIWVFQIATAFFLRRRFLIRTYPKNLPFPNDVEAAQLIAAHRGKVDINICSKNEMVYTLGLPIVYANDIEKLRNEGYIFTYLEELSEIAGLPESYLPRLAPMVIFSYDYRKEEDFSWRRLNSLSLEELMACNLDSGVAQKILAERQRNGAYKSLIDIQQRTGLPLNCYRHLV